MMNKGGSFSLRPKRHEGNTQPMLQTKLRRLDASQRSGLGVRLVLGGLLVLVVGIWFAHYSNFPATERANLNTEDVVGSVAGDLVDVGDGEMRVLKVTPVPEAGSDEISVDVIVDVDYFGWVPRGCLVGNNSSLVSTNPIIGVTGAEWCIPWFTVGHIVALIGSQMIVGGLAIALILGRKMTWALAAFAAFLAFFELVIWLGTVPSEWLNLAQGPLAWTEQSIAFPRENHPRWIATGWKWLMLNNDISISWGVIKDFISVNLNLGFLTTIMVFSWKIQDWGKPLEDEPPAETPLSPYGRPLVKAVD